MPVVTDDRAELSDQPAGPDPQLSAAVRWGILGVLAVLLVAALGILGARFFGSTGDPSLSKLGRTLVGKSASSGDSSLATDREAAMSQARKFTIALDTYGPDLLGPDKKTMPAYRKRVSALLTPKFQTAFDQNAQIAEATVSSQGAGRTADVYALGTASIDHDTATVLVVGMQRLTYPVKPGSSKRVAVAQQQIRWDVQLVKTHGAWLVDGYTPAEQAPDSLTGSGSGSGIGSEMAQ